LSDRVEKEDDPSVRVFWLRALANVSHPVAIDRIIQRIDDHATALTLEGSDGSIEHRSVGDTSLSILEGLFPEARVLVPADWVTWWQRERPSFPGAK